MVKTKYYFEDFTEAHYRYLLNIAIQNSYTFGFYDQYKEQGRIILWRHDVDLSLHRAYRLACIESEEGAKSTFFIHLHSTFYNFLEEENALLIQKIRDLGHQIGLHFDPNYYSLCPNGNDLIENLRFEKRILETLFDIKLHAFSLHDPTPEILKIFEKERVSLMVNTYSKFIMDHYSYSSDSSGYWRYERLKEVLKSGKYERLQSTDTSWMVGPECHESQSESDEMY